ncbi:MAG: DUF4381 family protein [Gammaproteobacteria bacterium]|nr:DUF4381 family protein [Gammaproteobacteria bacterium]
MKADLSQLRDIHLPAPVPWWPPAPGWWAVAAATLLTVALAWILYRRHRQNRWRRSALAALALVRESLPEHQTGQLSVLLRRVAISRFPRQEVAGLTGQDWLAFLDRTLDGGDAFRAGAGRVLIHGPYRRNETPVDPTDLTALCERWIRRLPTRRAA